MNALDIPLDYMLQITELTEIYFYFHVDLDDDLRRALATI